MFVANSHSRIVCRCLTYSRFSGWRLTNNESWSSCEEIIVDMQKKEPWYAKEEKFQRRLRTDMFNVKSLQLPPDSYVSLLRFYSMKVPQTVFQFEADASNCCLELPDNCLCISPNQFSSIFLFSIFYKFFNFSAVEDKTNILWPEDDCLQPLSIFFIPSFFSFNCRQLSFNCNRLVLVGKIWRFTWQYIGNCCVLERAATDSNSKLAVDNPTN